MELLLVLLGHLTVDLEQAHQLHGHKEAMVGAVALVLHALIQLGHALGGICGVLYGEIRVVLQLDLARLLQLVEKLEILQLVGYHLQVCHGWHLRPSC